MRVILYALVLTAAVVATDSATINCDSCSQTDVQAGIDASSDGDTVVIPAGDCSWTARVEIVSKAITLQGAGVGQTLIRRNIASSSERALRLSVTSGELVTIKDIEWRNEVNASNEGIVQIGGTWTAAHNSYRITDCKFYQTRAGRMVKVNGLYGLFDNCTFEDVNGGGQGISVFKSDNEAATNTWHTAQAFGTTNFVTVEDCLFDYDDDADGVMDCYDGSKILFRSNVVVNSNLGWHGADSGPRSLRLFEIYNNWFTNTTGSPFYTAIRSRGGTGVAYSNIVSSGFNSWILFSHNAADPTYSRAVWGLMTGSDPADGNFDAFGYPGLDQVGRGSFPAGTRWYDEGITSYVDEDQDYEELDPVYLWSNTVNGSTTPTASVGLPTESSNIIIEGRDYHDNVEHPSYAALVYPHPLRGEGGGSTPTGTITLGSGRITGGGRISFE